MTVKAPKKLIEVALPLDDINIASAREKSIRHGHPSTLHLWWARRPLAAARVVLFAQMVNDPGYERSLGRGVNKKDAAAERERLFEIIKKLVQWENTTNEAVLNDARAEIWKSWRETCHLNRDHPQAAELFNPEKLPAFHDPFAGGGAIPLEAQRLGLESYASDLNSVAVLINKAMIEIPPKFAGRKPVGPGPQGEKQATLHEDWSGANGLAEDVRRYGHWMREEAQKRIGHLYPPVEITPEMVQERPDLKPLVGQKLTVIAWLWARTVKSPNPAYSHVDVPLASTFILSTKEGKEAYVEPVVEGDSYCFTVKVGKPANAEQVKHGTKLARGANFRCVVSDSPIEPKHIYTEANARHMGARLLAVVAEGPRGRVYLSPTPEVEEVSWQAQPTWKPEIAMPKNPRWFSPPLYGLKTFGDLFTPRQLVALSTFSDLVQEARERIKQDALVAGVTDDGLGLDAGGTGATAYADAVAVYLALSASKSADNNSTICSWMPGIKYEVVRNTFSRQALPMSWDYAEANPFAASSGDFYEQIKRMLKVFEISLTSSVPCFARQMDAQTSMLSFEKVISTDPPYYDNIGYADLSDFFYVWLRYSQRAVFPGLFATLAVPKAEELVATPYRHGSKEAAEAFFMEGMTRAMHRLAEQAHPAFPVTIYYAFKQSDSSDNGIASTGWETFLEAVLKAGFALTGTWPIRTEREGRTLGVGTNALASSIVLVCRQRAPDAPTISRREFLRELNAMLPEALDEMTRGGVNSPVAPVDLSQAIIGPGMAIFSKYAAVLEADGTPMRVRTALQLINRFLAEDDFDADTQFCLHWFETHGWSEGRFGEADVLARAKGTSVDGVAEAGVLASGKGAVRLLRYAEYPADWSPENDARTPVWEALHHLIRALQSGGESASGALLAKMPARTEAIRQLAYRLYTLCERQGRAEEARAYNELITSWEAVEAASHTTRHVESQLALNI
jgi:putative DNA methylase